MAIDKKISPPLHTLDKCNPRISGNFKFVCDDDDIYIDSINSTSELSRSLYKSYKVNTNNNLMANAKNFFDLFTVKDDIFSVKQDKNYIVTNYENQHDRIYNYGAYSDESELITKRFRFFAPIKINEESTTPDLFMIYRVDRESFNSNSSDWKKELLFTHDFRTSAMGEQLDRHITYLKNYEFDMGIFCNYGDNISYTGTSITSGLVQSKYEDDFDSLLANERTITEFNNYIVDGYRRNGVIDTRFLNLEFCFDIDLEDEELNDKFVDIIGVYVTLDELNNVDSFNISEHDIKVLEDNGKISISTENEITEVDLSDNYIKVGEHLGVQYTSKNFLGDLPPLVMIKPNFIPSIGDRIVLSYNGNVEVTYQISESDVVSGDIMATAENISSSLKEFARVNVSNLFIDSFIHDGEYIVIRSLLNDETFNNIKVDVLPQQYTIIEPIFSSDTYDNTFYSPSQYSVLTTQPIGMSSTLADSLRLGENISNIQFVGRWLSYYFYNLDSSLKTEDSSPELFESIRSEKSKLYQCDIVEHRKFDFDRETTYHEDVFDFELVAYKNWLINQINDSSFLGKYDTSVVTVSDTEMSTYRTELISIVNRYFDSISLDRNMLLKDINTDDFQGTSTTNEFERLSENDNINLLKTNITVQHINKFMFANGLDVYNRPYTLNLGLPFRYGNFAPSLDNYNRDLRDSTHSWMIIGEGIPPYFNDLEIDGKPILNQVEVDTEQIVNTIDRFYGDIGETTELDEWVFSNASLSVGDTVSTGVLSLSSSEGFVSRPINILPESTSGSTKFNYVINIESSRNANINIKLDIINNETIEVYKTWTVNRNVISGEKTVIDEIEEFRISDISENTSLRISIPVGWATDIELVDLNFYKSTLLQNTIDETINLDVDSVTGTLKYVDDMISGYSNIPLSIESIQSTTSDVFNYIRSHSLIREEDGAGTCFFRGLKCSFSSKYVGWKFASVLLTRTAPYGEDRSIQLYENNIFKSIILVVNMYIPEPVLTSLEVPTQYWLDRSLLYFSDGNYATDDSLQSFGLEDLSLKINDESFSPKTYLGRFVTNDWYFQTGGKNLIHVSKGIRTRFNVDFTSILTLGGNFEAFFGNTDDTETIEYGMLITFKEIQEITEDYFWCSEINVRIKENNGGNIDVIEYDMLESFLNNGNVFVEENRMDIVEAILLENAKYDRVLKNTSAIDRFSLLSTASIFEWLNSNKVQVNSEDGTTHFDSMTAFTPSVNEGVISYTESDNEIETLSTKYTNTFIRQNGVYDPITKLLRKSGSKFTIDYVDYAYANKASNGDILPSTQSNYDKNNGAVWFYRNNYANTDLSSMYRYYLNRLDYIDIDWYANPIEYRHEISTILSSSEELTFQTIYTGETIDVYDGIKEYLSRVMTNTGYSPDDFTDEEKINIISLSNSGVDDLTLDQYDFEDIILRRFYKSVINEIYTVNSVYDIDNEILLDFFEISDDIIEINDSIEIGTNLEFKVDRI